MNPAQIVEAVLFASDTPLHAQDIARADESLDEDVVEAAIADLRSLYSESERSFDIVDIAGGYQVLTRPEFSTYLERFDSVPRPSRLSGPALETLAIISYRQPISRVEIEYIRGVGSSGVIRTLQDRELVDVVGREEGIGRPFLYGTTDRFLEHFGFDSLEDLPRPEELPVVLRDRVPLDEDEDAGEDADQDAAADGEAIDGEVAEESDDALEAPEVEDDEELDDAPEATGAGQVGDADTADDPHEPRPDAGH